TSTAALVSHGVDQLLAMLTSRNTAPVKAMLIGHGQGRDRGGACGLRTGAGPVRVVAVSACPRRERRSVSAAPTGEVSLVVGAGRYPGLSRGNPPAGAARACA